MVWYDFYNYGFMRVYFFQQVQFNLQLSEKEQIDRAKVVLPFEHQGTESGMLVCVCVFSFFEMNYYITLPDVFSICNLFN